MGNAKLHPFTVQEVVTNAQELIPQGVQFIHAPAQWATGNTGKGVVVAVIDTGVDYNHPDLKANIIGGKDFTGKGDYLDGNGHGTHVSGTIAATNTGAGVVGVAPDVKILALKALGDDGSGDMNNVTEAIRYATAYGVDLISMSLGGPDSPELHQAVKDAVAKGITVVVAAGNDGDGNPFTEELSYPGAYDEVIEVGAIDFTSHVAYFSNTNHEVDILAPGVGILSTYLNGQYAKLDGTSMATPHVAGAVALLKSKVVADYTHGDFILNVAPKNAAPSNMQEPDVSVPDAIPAPVTEVPGPAPVAPKDPVVPPAKLSFWKKFLELLRKLFGGK